MYQLLYSDGSLAPDGTLAWNELLSMPTHERNLVQIRNFTHRFEAITARYLRLFYPTSEGGAILGGGLDGRRFDGLGFVSEFQVFGQGHPQRVVLRSPVIDLGAEWNITSLSWDAQVPNNAGIIFRSRSGETVIEDTRYFDKNRKEITKRRWEKSIKSFRGPIDTTLQPGADWSPWSEEYTVSETNFHSPSPRHYFQLEAELFTTHPSVATTLHELIVNFTRPLAGTAQGEITPLKVEPGIEQEFIYFLRRDFGFDHITIEASVPMHFTALYIDNVPITTISESSNNGFRLSLPTTITNDTLLAIHFNATILQNHTRFQAFMERHNDQEILRQRVDPGDAVPQLTGTGDMVSLPVNDQLFTHLEIANGFTPNSDGINDVLSIRFDILKLITPRPVQAWISDLQGNRLRHLLDTLSLTHQYDLYWDGRNDQNQLLPPSLYLFHLSIDGDAKTQNTTRVIGLSY